MTEALLGIAVVLLVLLALGVWLSFRRRGAEDVSLASFRADVQSALASHSDAVNAQLSGMVHTVVEQLGRVSDSLQTGLANSGNVVSQAQIAVASELARVEQQLGEMRQAGREIFEATRTLQNVLGGAKTRGALGEIALEALLADALPQNAYETQYRFSTGATVDAIVRAGSRIVAIDSKFPLDSYRRLSEKTGEEAESARREFFQAVRKHAESIASKYILQEEGTLDVALMFVPSEGVYYELLMTADAKLGRLDEYCRSRGIISVSPNTMQAYLSVILMGIKGLQVEENARHLQAGLAGLQTQLAGFAKMYETLGGHIRHAQQCYEDADRKLERTRNALDQMAQGALPETQVRALEPAVRD